MHFNIHKFELHHHGTKNRHVALVQTVSENETGFRKWQLNNSKLARELYSKVVNPTQKDFNNLIKSNIIRNFPVTLEDTNRS